jgi:hypothetical protein
MKCSTCKEDITGMDSHICAGSTVAGISTDAIKRYEPYATGTEIEDYGCFEDENGNYIKYIDYAAIISENSQLKARVKFHEETIEQAERRGYELACEFSCEETNYLKLSRSAIGMTYEQACADRDKGKSNG